MTIELKHAPKGGMCVTCDHQNRDCSHLLFENMPPIGRPDGSGAVIVRCIDYSKTKQVIPKMKSVTGHVTYDVKVRCPHCDGALCLNQYPYNDENDELYGQAEDLLGKEVFGSPSEPAKWRNFEIEYTCTHCQNAFFLTALEA